MPDQRFWVYRNLTRGIWSVKQGSQGRVEHHLRVFLQDPVFHVQPGGQRRVLREKRKNVHAFVIGEAPLIVDTPGYVEAALECWGPPIQVRYNPYKFKTFFAETEDHISSASAIFADCHGKIWAFNPNCLQFGNLPPDR